jgi:hypothetical protein
VLTLPNPYPIITISPSSYPKEGGQAVPSPETEKSSTRSRGRFER